MSRYSILLDDQKKGPPTPDHQVKDEPMLPRLTPPSTQDQTLEVGKEGSRQIGKEGKRGQSREPAQVEEGAQLFDLNQKPYRKDSFLFTDEEFEALEDL